MLDEWAAHFREQYRYLDALDMEREGTGISREEFLRDYVFPGQAKPGPATRVGDFCEILSNIFRVIMYPESDTVVNLIGTHHHKAVMC